MELLNVGQHLLVNVVENVLADAQRVRHLEHGKERRQHQRLHEAVEQRRRPVLEFAVPDELGDPAAGPDPKRDFVAGGSVQRRQLGELDGAPHQKQPVRQAVQQVEPGVEQSVADCRHDAGIEVLEPHRVDAGDDLADPVRKMEPHTQPERRQEDHGDAHHMNRHVDVVVVIFAVKAKFVH